MKQCWKPGTMLNPLPVVLVSCGTPEASNLITVAWAGTVCTNPPMLSISVRPQRYSYDIILRTGEFTVNLTTAYMARATDWCGVRSGRYHYKWAATGLTPVPGVAVSCPAVEQSPVSIECKVRQIIPLGSHDMFLADVLNVMADEAYIDPESGAFDLGAADLLSYSHGKYYGTGPLLGHFGFSVRKKSSKTRKK